MEREVIEKLKKEFKPVQERGRRMFGKQLYDKHIKELLEYFGCDTKDDIVKEIFNI